MLGGAHFVVVLGAASAVLLCGVWALASGSLGRIPAPALVFAVLGTYSLVQSLPLPVGLVRHLSPLAAEIWERALLPFGEHSSHASLSLDPGASSLEAVKWLAYAIAFWLAANFARHSGVVHVVELVLGSALLVALATLGHNLLGATRVFGIYQPQLGPSPDHIGPFLNPNCLAGYLTLGAMCGLGLIVASKSHFRRALWALATALTIGVEVLSGSRGGVFALAVGVSSYAVCSFVMQRRRRGRKILYSWVAGIATLTAAGGFAAMGVRDSWFELSDKDLSKLRMARWVEPMVRDFPLFGVGRGAFESAFPAYKRVAGDLVFTNPENIFAQWFSEWGIIAAAVGLGLLLWQLRPARSGVGRSELATAAMVGVCAMVLQNCVDFSLELFAPMLAVAVLTGACWGRHGVASSRASANTAIQAPALLMLAGLSLCLSFVRSRHPVSLERAALRQEFADSRVQDEALWGQLRQAIGRHPAEPYFPRLAALLALRGGRIEPLPWIERALEQGPVDSRTHWILAQTLYLHGHLDQALLEARLAVEYDPGLAAGIGAKVARWAPQLEAIQSAAPRGRGASQMLLASALALDPALHGRLREELLRQAIKRDPSFSPAHQALANELIRNLRSERCANGQRRNCERDISTEAAALDELKPQSADGSELVAQLSAQTDQLGEAERMLSARCPTLEQSERVRCWRALFSAAVARGDRGLIARSAERLTATACALGIGCQGALLEAGNAMAHLQNRLEAFNYAQKAVQLDPQVAPLLQLADAAAALGRFSVASRALLSAAAHARETPALREQILQKERALRETGLSAGNPLN